MPIAVRVRPLLALIAVRVDKEIPRRHPRDTKTAAATTVCGRFYYD
jgi:hypothetical protein